MAKKIKYMQTDMLSKYDLTHFHARYIIQLYYHNEMTMTELTNNIGVDKANTTRVIRDLLRKGLVERASEGIRNYSLKLSVKGREVAEYFKQKMTNFKNKLLNNFSQEEKTTFFALLNKLLLGVKNVGDC